MDKLTKQKIALLKQVKERLSKRERFICCILSDVHTDGNFKAYLCLKQYIKHSIEYQYTFEDWLERHHPELFKKWLNENTLFENTLKCRLAWIDWMIASLEGKV